MTDKFSDTAPHSGGFQQSSDNNYNNSPNFRIFSFKEPNFRNLCDQHSIRNIPSQIYGGTSSLSQLPPPPLPPPPPPPKLHETNFNAGNRFPLESYPHPPPSTYPPPLTLQSHTGTDFSISCKQPVVQNPASFRQPVVHNLVSCRSPNIQKPLSNRQPIIQNPVTCRLPNIQNSMLCRPPNTQNPDYSKSPPVRPPFCYNPPTQNLMISQPSSEVMHKEHKDPITSSSNKTGDIILKRSPAKSDKEDKFYIQNWMSNVQKRLKTEESMRKTKEIKISDIQKKLLRYAILIKELKDLLKYVSDSSPASDNFTQKQRESLMKRADKLKIDIKELKRYFSEEETIKEILNKRREKRLKRRKTKGERNKKWKKRKEEWKKIEEEMDKKIRMENEEEKEKLEQEKLKREADMVLREVRSKQEDVVRMQKLLQALTALRDIRKNKGEMHGYVENPDASAFFDKMKNEFETILSDQQKVYQTEEQTLKIMIEESQCSMFSSRKRHPLFTPDLNQVKKDIHKIYFGRERPRLEAEKEYERSFLAAEESVEILVQRRKDWDQFIVGDNSGTSIPIGWVLPNLNPSSDWKAYQES